MAKKTVQHRFKGTAKTWTEYSNDPVKHSPNIQKALAAIRAGRALKDVKAGGSGGTTVKNVKGKTGKARPAGAKRAKPSQRAFARSKKPLLVLGRADGRPNRAAGGTAG